MRCESNSSPKLGLVGGGSRRRRYPASSMFGVLPVAGLLGLAAPLADARAQGGEVGCGHAGHSDGHGRYWPMVQVQEGKLRGERSDDVDHFWAIPFAAPPVGDLRWRLPERPESWHGVRDATAPPPRCPQRGEGQEDCLYLNVHRPSSLRHRGPLPVIFFIHGGGNRLGSSFDNDPSGIVQEAGVIVVMANYRLGSLGWLAHSALSAESPQAASGQYGLADQQAALRWVHDNISAFGGDPERVVLAGGSSGGFGVCTHLASPAVAGLFSGAAMISSSCPAAPLEEAEGYGAEFVAEVGCPEDDPIACLRQKSAEELTAVPSFVGVITHPGSLVSEPPLVVIREGRAAPVPLFIGGTEHDSRMGRRTLFPVDEAEYVANVIEFFGQAVGEVVLDQYDPDDYDDPFYAESDLLSDSGLLPIGACLNRDIAQAHADYAPVYVYEFADSTAPMPEWAAANAPEGFVMGASHASDEIYWFDRPQEALRLAESQRKLANQMRRSIGNFAWRGSPSPRRHPELWPAYDVASERVLRFEPGGARAVDDWAEQHKCEFWRSLDY